MAPYFLMVSVPKMFLPAELYGTDRVMLRSYRLCVLIGCIFPEQTIILHNLHMFVRLYNFLTDDQ